MNSEEFLKIKNLKEHLDEDGGILIEPSSCYVIKAFDKKNEKVFINITSHPIIDEPEQKFLVNMEVKI